MKTCKTCGEEKPYELFSRRAKNKDGYQSHCKDCYRAKYCVGTPKQITYPLLPGGRQQCSLCKEIKVTDLFYKDSSRSSGITARCKECKDALNKKRAQEDIPEDKIVKRIWREANRDRMREYHRQYRAENGEAKRISHAKRRARKKSLPDTLTVEQTDKILEAFSNKCAICDNDYEHLDHFIPLSCGHGGTTYENMVPMCATCNLSKNARNPFIWAESLPKHERERFDDLVTYLTVINGITDVESYKAHVHQCFK